MITTLEAMAMAIAKMNMKREGWTIGGETLHTITEAEKVVIRMTTKEGTAIVRMTIEEEETPKWNIVADLLGLADIQEDKLF